MVTYLVAGVGNRAKNVVVLGDFSVFADNEPRDVPIPLLENTHGSRHDGLQVAGELLPRIVAISLEVGPFVVEVERQRCLFPIAHWSFPLCLYAVVFRCEALAWRLRSSPRSRRR